MKTHLIVADNHRRASLIAEDRGLLRWEFVSSSARMLGLREVVLHLQRGYVETPKLTHCRLNLPGGRSIAWGVETDFPILRTIQNMIASGAITEVRPDA